MTERDQEPREPEAAGDPSQQEHSKKEIGRDELEDVTGGANAQVPTPAPPPGGGG